jgi:prepilin-type N-terminal cleavage/methylation domain-containing protein
MTPTSQRRLQPGVTLIEILIAVSLLSLLSVGILIAMRLGLNTMDKTDNRLVENRRVANARKIIENEIAGFTFTYATFVPMPTAFQKVPFFQAESASMRFVTTYSLQDAWRGQPQIAALQVIPGEKNQGVRLIVDEVPYTGPLQAGRMITSIEPDPATGRALAHFVPIEAGPRSFVLADRLAYCRFSYLGAIPRPPFQVWLPGWPAGEQLALGVRVEMAPLDPQANGLQVSSVTAPINVTRKGNGGAPYVD